MKKWFFAVFIIIVLIILIFVFFKERSASSAPPSTLVSVYAAQAKLADIPIHLEATGFVTAQEKVDIKPQVSGIVSKIYIAEGQNVRPGELLFALNAAEEQAQLSKAQAQRFSDVAQLKNAQRDLLRSQDLFKKNFVSQSVIDANQSKVDTLVATVAADQAQVEAAQVALSYKTLRASIPGKVGTISVHPGTLVQPGMIDPMVTITRLHPITVTFTLPESDLLLAHRAIMSEVTVTLPDNPGQIPLKGKLVFVDSVVNNGVFALKAEFSNEDNLLFPGQFVNVQLKAGRYEHAAKLPVTAVLTGNENKFYYRVNSNHTVEAQPVTLLAIHKDKAIVQGAKEGDLVVMNGGLNLRPGQKVRVLPDKPARSGGQ